MMSNEAVAFLCSMCFSVGLLCGGLLVLWVTEEKSS